jgi:4-oxalocrotonate tautomerase
MPVLSLKLRKPATVTQKRKIIQSLCQDAHQQFGIPLDKLVVLIEDVPAANWGQAGVSADHPDYDVLSRKQSL